MKFTEFLQECQLTSRGFQKWLLLAIIHGIRLTKKFGLRQGYKIQFRLEPCSSESKCFLVSDFTWMCDASRKVDRTALHDGSLKVDRTALHNATQKVDRTFAQCNSKGRWSHGVAWCKSKSRSPPRPNPASVSDRKADRYGLGSRTVASFFETDLTSSGCLWHTLRLFYWRQHLLDLLIQITKLLLIKISGIVVSAVWHLLLYNHHN